MICQDNLAALQVFLEKIFSFYTCFIQMCVGKVYEAESAFKNNQTFLHGEPLHLLLQLRIEREKCLCAINVSVGDMPFVFTGFFSMLFICTVMKI